MADPEAVPESTLPYPPLHLDKKFVVLSDWYVIAYTSPWFDIKSSLRRDGTITTRDSNDCGRSLESILTVMLIISFMEC
jgi:hypothetical protein